ncbi:methylated-DNA--[protein]-cysteine S-methyltransferase [Lactobacillus sp. YT155]|uniref:methylated-DNA--[protein]-cysteine S-methyltransferase n=1 Tax=Lactobacillus sp. YT155 TaxID=3060955 RepID=UPI00265E5730|nr:methylated-DNA--[protein]-cysteine S-methyltransferase [Lactobacillus sp. YT155]MDO1605848.1 methylated-DNA--[protein]-cysteine S-methyltransferase [Lactobacillus sp. YT155]
MKNNIVSEKEFQADFSKILEELPNKNAQTLYWSLVKTKLGSMVVISDDEKIFLLEFVNNEKLTKEIPAFKKRLNAKITKRKTDVIQQLQKELDEYFAGKRINFDLPTQLVGTDFQESVWKELTKIPSGQTISYKDLARGIGNPNATRAAANATGKNPVALIVPCHRVISNDGSIGGYGGGLDRKEWLLEHEREVKK